MRALVTAGHEIVLVVSQPDKKRGRGGALVPSPVKQAAQELGLPVTDRVDDLLEAGAELGVVVAYGRLIRPHVLAAVPRVNIHFSLLPRWRGAAPVERAILAGDDTTGVCLMELEEGLDTGPVCLAERVAIGPDETAGALHDRLARLGADLMLRGLGALARGMLTCRPQPAEGVTYAKKIDKAETRIDWAWPASEVHNHIRGLSPFPGAWFEVQAGEEALRIKALRSTLAEGSGAPGEVLDDRLTVACREGAVRLVEVQRAGRSPMRAEEFRRGTPIPAGMRLA